MRDSRTWCCDYWETRLADRIASAVYDIFASSHNGVEDVRAAGCVCSGGVHEVSSFVLIDDAIVHDTGKGGGGEQLETFQSVHTISSTFL